MIKAKISTAAALILIVSLLFSGCGAISEQQDGRHVIEKPGDLTIVRSEVGSEAVIRASLRIREEIERACGVNVPIITDYISSNEDAKSGGAHLILVGATNYDESCQFEKALSSGNKYIIKSVNGKTVIAASCDSLLGEAVERFLSDYVYTNGETVTIEDNIECEFDADEDFFEIIRSHSARCDFVIPADASATLIGVCEYVAQRLNTIFDADMKILTSDQISNPVNMITVGLVGDGVGEVVASKLPADSFSVIMRDGRLAVVGRSDEASAFALINLYLYLSENYDTTLEGLPFVRYRLSEAEKNDEILFGTFEPDHPAFPDAKLVYSEIITSNISICKFEGGYESAFDAYVALLECVGYEIVSTGRAEEIYSVSAKNVRMNMQIDAKLTPDGSVTVTYTALK